MTVHVNLIVEGQTEEAFAKAVLMPHLASAGVYLHPKVVQFSPRSKGGIVRYDPVRADIIRWMKSDRTPGLHFSTMFDLYALPDSFPGNGGAGNADIHARARAVELAIRNDILGALGDKAPPPQRFIPYVQVHEFEALLFVEPEAFGQVIENCGAALKSLRGMRKTFASPEHINDSRETAPSKRIEKVLPGYRKRLHGPAIAAKIGLDAIRRECLHFNEWLTQLEKLAG